MLQQNVAGDDYTNDYQPVKSDITPLQKVLLTAQDIKAVSNPSADELRVVDDLLKAFADLPRKDITPSVAASELQQFAKAVGHLTLSDTALKWLHKALRDDLNPVAVSPNTFAQFRAVFDKERKATLARKGKDMGGIQGGRGVYNLRDDGVYYSKPLKDGGYASPVKICGWLTVTAETYDVDAGGHGKLLVFTDTRNRQKQWPMPAQLTAGDGLEVIRVLLARGLWMRNGSEKELIDYVMSCPTDTLMTCTERTGWLNGAFVTPDKVYGADADSIIYQPLHHVDTGYGMAGTLASWGNNVAAYAVGNSRLAFSISTAFAGPLLDAVGMPGFIIHFWGGSSIGKTTLLLLAAGVWGDPSGYMRQWLATAVGLEGTAYAHNDGLLVLDEIGEATAQTVAASAYMLANGLTKVRGGRDGNAKAPKKFRLCALSSGEHTLDHMMRAAGMVTRAGQEIRMLHVQADAGVGCGIFDTLHGFGDGAALSEHIKAASSKDYGTAGDSWLQAITADGGIPDDIVKSVDAIRDGLLPDGASGQVRRVARQFALVAFAGELATKHGITGWPAGEATRAAEVCFYNWLDGFGGADGNRENRQIIEAVQAYLTRHIAKFEDLTAETTYPVQDRAGFRRPSMADGDEYIVPPTQLTRLADGYSKDQIIAALRTVGMINEPTTNGRGRDGKPQYCYTTKVRTPEGNKGYFVIQSEPRSRSVNMPRDVWEDADGEPAPF